MNNNEWKNAVAKSLDFSPEYERLVIDMTASGCNVTLSKTCVWISGNTYPIRQSLKNAGWKWSAKKKAWWMPIDRYCGTENQTGIEKLEEPNGDYKLCGKTNDGNTVVIAECHCESLV